MPPTPQLHTVTSCHLSWNTTEVGQVGYGITNPEYQGEVVLTIDRNMIVGVSTVDGSHLTGRQS